MISLMRLRASRPIIGSDRPDSADMRHKLPDGPKYQVRSLSFADVLTILAGFYRHVAWGLRVQKFAVE